MVTKKIPGRRGGKGGLKEAALGALIAALLVLLVCPPARAQVDITGSLSTQYRFRSSGEDSDQDVYEYLDLNVGNPVGDRITFHMFGRAALDVEGNTDSDDYYVFDSIDDTYDQSYNFRLYHAYADFHGLPGLGKLRLGRQMMWDAPVTTYFDGGLIETAPLDKFIGLSLGAYGGWPVHLYEPDPEGNSLYGAYLNSRPWPGARFRLDYTHVENEYIYGDESNNLYSASYWQTLSEYFRFNVNYTHLDEDPYYASGYATLYVPQWDLIVQGRYYELLETQKNYAIDFDPFYAPLYEYYPYWQGGLVVYKGLGENLALEAGVDGRGLKDEDDEGIFNHEWLRYYGTFYVRDLPAEGLEASVTGERFESYTDDDQEITSYTGDLTYHPNKSLKLSAGADFSLYKYNYYWDTEEENSYTYYFRLKYYPVPSWRLDLAYEFEDGEEDDFQEVKVGLRYEFGASDEN